MFIEKQIDARDNGQGFTRQYISNHEAFPMISPIFARSESVHSFDNIFPRQMGIGFGNTFAFDNDVRIVFTSLRKDIPTIYRNISSAIGNRHLRVRLRFCSGRYYKRLIPRRKRYQCLPHTLSETFRHRDFHSLRMHFRVLASDSPAFDNDSQNNGDNFRSKVNIWTPDGDSLPNGYFHTAAPRKLSAMTASASSSAITRIQNLRAAGLMMTISLTP